MKNIYSKRAPWKGKITSKYIGVSGGTFKTFLNNPSYFKKLKETSPDIVVAILGGNDIKDEATLDRNFKECLSFYKTLRQTVPNAYILASQVETRYCRPNNRHGCPTHPIFDDLRRRFNKFLEDLKYHDFVLEIEGDEHLDGRENYRDGVHLSNKGFEKYLDIIQCSLLSASCP